MQVFVIKFGYPGPYWAQFLRQRLYLSHLSDCERGSEQVGEGWGRSGSPQLVGRAGRGNLCVTRIPGMVLDKPLEKYTSA